MTATAIWLAVALVLGVAELLLPGLFLVFVAAAAAMTGLTLLAAPALPLAGQLASAAIWSAVAVAVGRRWYRDYPVAGDARLNAPAARLVGCEVTAEAMFVDGVGRVRVGDGGWPARGCNAAAGERLRVVAVEAGMLVVEWPLSRHRRESGDPSLKGAAIQTAAIGETTGDGSPLSRG